MGERGRVAGPGTSKLPRAFVVHAVGKHFGGARERGEVENRPLAIGDDGGAGRGEGEDGGYPSGGL